MTAPRAPEPHRPPSPPDRLPSRRGGRPASRTVSAAGRRGLLRSALALLALSGALALPATAHADVVSNLDVTGPGTDGVWNRGERVEVRVRFRLPVRVQLPDGGRAPVLALVFFDNAPEERRFRSLAVAQYTRGSGTDTLTFAYTVTVADAGADHVVVVDNGLLDRDGAIRTLDGGGSETTFEQTRAGPVEVVLDGGVDHAWSAGERIRVRVTFFDEVTVDTAGGTPTIGLRLGDERGLRNGIALFGGGFTGTPHLGVGLTESGRDYRLGWRLTSARRGDPGFEINLDATRREAANANAEHGIALRGTIRW